MKIRYVGHAKKRMLLRNIQEYQVVQVLLDPTETIKSKKEIDRYLSYRFFDYISEYKTTRFLVVVHTDKRIEPINIISTILKTRNELKIDGFNL
jgi:uncharacterized DUF497 family protein